MLAIQCSFTKFVVAVPIPDKQATTVADAFVRNVVLVHGVPDVIVSDCGTEFVNSVFENITKLLGIDKRTTSPFHPQANGQIERFFSTYANLMSTIIDKRQSS